jgi:tRNA dimethylallyltransferase
MTKKGIVIVGPTASGKSKLAVDVALKFGGEIVNADSLQLYKELRLLTSRPSKEEEAQVPHHLYGAFDGDYNSTAFKWLKIAVEKINDIINRKKTPIIVGGTGLYIKTLVKGISNIPELPIEAREKSRRLFRELGQEDFLAMLKKKDEDFKATDPQRMIRAWEVIEGTGKTLSYWQSLGLRKEIEADWLVIYINPPRPVLYEQCEARFDYIVQNGAIDEVKNLLDMSLEPSLSVMKAIGVRELTDYIRGHATLENASNQSKQATKNYAKRQVTWFSHQIDPDIVVPKVELDELTPQIENFLK